MLVDTWTAQRCVILMAVFPMITISRILEFGAARRLFVYFVLLLRNSRVPLQNENYFKLSL
jgi:hypothetical protein